MKAAYPTEWVKEAEACLNRGHMVDETVVRGLLRALAEAHGLEYIPVTRGSLERPVVFDHDRHESIFPEGCSVRTKTFTP